MEAEDNLYIIIWDQYGDRCLHLCKTALEAATIGLEVTFVTVKNEEEAASFVCARYSLFIHSCCIVGEDMVRSVLCYMDEHPEVSPVEINLLDGRGSLVQASELSFSNSSVAEKENNSPTGLDMIGGVCLKCGTAVQSESFSWMERALGALTGRKPRRKSNRRLLVLSNKASFQEVKAVCLREISEMEFVNVWNLEENRPLDAISRSTQMKNFTDIVFCYPNIRFEQVLLFMDKMPNKSINYYIYNKQTGELVSP